jgi:CheY-like chemotaxis protein
MVDVAVIDTSEEAADIVEEALRSRGWSTARGYAVDFKRGRADLTTFLREHDPAVVLWDLAVPYEENWEYLQEIRGLPAARGRHFVLTSFNVAALREFIGPAAVFEIIGKPVDLEQLSEIVEQGLEASGRDGQVRRDDRCGSPDTRSPT